MFGFDMEHLFEFGGRVTRLRTLNQGFGCIEKVAETRKPHGPAVPQPQGIKLSDRSQCVIFAPMRIAAEVLHVCQLAKNRTASRIAERGLKLAEGCYFMVIVHPYF